MTTDASLNIKLNGVIIGDQMQADRLKCPEGERLPLGTCISATHHREGGEVA